MKNLSIRTKIVAVLAPIILILVALAGLAVLQMGQIRADAMEIEDNWLPSIQTLGGINTATSDYRIAEGSHVMSTTDIDMTNAEKDMASVESALSNLRETYEQHISSAEERATYEKFAESWDSYMTHHAQILALSGQNLNEQASQVFKVDSRKAFDDASAAIVELVDMNDEGAALAGKRAEEAYGIAVVVAAASAIAAFLAAIFLGWLLVKSLSPPVKDITSVMKQLTNGNLNVEIAGSDRRDELGEMAAAVRVFKDNMIETERLRAEQQREQQRQLERAAKINASVSAFDKRIGEVVQVVASAASELQSTAQAMSGAAEETSSQSMAVAAASEQTSQNVQTVAVATEELTASIREIERQTAESSRLASGAVARANLTGEQINHLMAAYSKIEGVIDIINGIAAQTTLLALNATMEAARAGEAGRGFAVVASEVKSLASQTAKSTEDISAAIREIRTAVNEADASIAEISVSIGHVSEAGNGIAAAVQQQGSATREISRNVEEAARGTQGVSSNISAVTEAASHTGVAASQVLAAAGELARNGEVLRGQVASFLSEVRAA